MIYVRENFYCRVAGFCNCKNPDSPESFVMLYSSTYMMVKKRLTWKYLTKEIVNSHSFNGKYTKVTFKCIPLIATWYFV